MFIFCFIFFNNYVTAEMVYMIGITGLIVLSIVAGFVQEKIALIVLRAIMGICQSLLQ